MANLRACADDRAGALFGLVLCGEGALQRPSLARPVLMVSATARCNPCILWLCSAHVDLFLHDRECVLDNVAPRYIFTMHFVIE